MQVSVIIPVYNAAGFVVQAVESALGQPETGEVILIEDGSPDGSNKVCQELAAKYDRVRLFQHPKERNKGAGASRNLGMKNACFGYLAFLDADDFYLPGRFEGAKVVFDSDPECEGVYEAIGRYVEDEEGLNRWEAAKRPDYILHTVSANIPPERLCEVLILGERGDFHLNGLVIKRNVLEKSGYMDETLELHQDTDFILKLTATSKLLPGKLDEPVAMWRIHDHNRISAPGKASKIKKNRLKFWLNFYKWSKKNASREIQLLSLNKLIKFVNQTKNISIFPTRFFPDRLVKKTRLFIFLLRHPLLIQEEIYRGWILHFDEYQKS